MIRIKRRDFIKATAVTVGAAGLSGPVLNSFRMTTAHASEPIGESPVVEWKPTTCEGCTTWCAVEVGIQTDPATAVKRAVDVRGNQYSNSNSGYVCPRGRLSLQEVYDPDRIKTPMKRTNPAKGIGVDPGFVPITWSEAVDTIAQKLTDLRGTEAATSESHKVVVLRGRYTEMNEILYGDFPKIYGTPNKISHSSNCAEAEKFGYLHTAGLFGYCDYDIENCDYLMLWGVDPVSSNRMVAGAIGQLGNVLESKTVTVVDPRLSTSAAKAQRWLPVKPGTDGALALAMAHWILVQGLWNRDFVGDAAPPLSGFPSDGSEYTGDFTEKGTAGLVRWWNLEVRHRTPAWAAGITGIDEDTIKQVATDFANAQPKAISWLGPGVAMAPRGAYGAMAVAALNGLVGSLDHFGGTLPITPSYSPGTTSWRSNSLYIDAIGTSGYGKQRVDMYDTTVQKKPPLGTPAMSTSLGGVAVTNKVADAINAGAGGGPFAYDVKMAIGYWHNFAHSGPGAQDWREAFSKIYYVHMGTNACETSQFADIVLPTPHHLYETLAYMAQKARKWNILTLNQKVIDRLWDVREAETEFVWLLAERLNVAYGWSKLYDYLRTYVKPFDDGTPGETVGDPPTNEEQFHRFATQYRTCGTSATNWTNLLGAYNAGTGVGNGIRQATYAGGYFVGGKGEAWDFATGTVRGSAKFGTNSNKIEFFSSASKLKALLNEHSTNHAGATYEAIMSAANYPETAAGIATLGNDYALMPHWEPPGINGDEGTYPFALIDYKSRLNREGRSQNCPWYYAFKAVDAGDERWSDVIKMNPVDAASLGLVNKDLVKVTSPSNPSTGIAVRLKLWEGVRPGTVAKCYGQGHSAYGRVASTVYGSAPRGGNNNLVIPDDPEHLSGSGARNAITRVKIEKA